MPFRLHADALVGRERELDALHGAFSGEHRLFWICGPPGIGKSRLAHALVTQRTPLPMRIVYFDAELDGLPAVARVEAENIDLLVLDHADDLASSLGPSVRRLLGLSPRLRVLVVTRRRPVVAGSMTLHLGPLSAADAALLAVDADCLDAADGVPAVLLGDPTYASGVEKLLAQCTEEERASLAAAACFVGTIDRPLLQTMLPFTAPLSALCDAGWLEHAGDELRMSRPLRAVVRRVLPSAQRTWIEALTAAAEAAFADRSFAGFVRGIEWAAQHAGDLAAAEPGTPVQSSLFVAFGNLGMARSGVGVPLPVDDPDDPARMLFHAELERQRGDYAAARRRLEGLSSVPSGLRTEWLSTLTMALLGFGEVANARELMVDVDAEESPAQRAYRQGVQAYLEHCAGGYETAAALYPRAVDALAATGAWIRSLRLQLSHAFLELERRRFGAARELLDQLVSRFRQLGMRLLEGIALGYLGNAARAERDFVTARRCYADAREVLRAAGSPMFAQVFTMDAAVTELLAHRLVAARELLDSIEDQATGRLVALVRGYRALCAAAADAPDTATHMDRVVVPSGHAYRTFAEVVRRARSGAAEPPALDSSHEAIAGEIANRLKWAASPRDCDVALVGREVWLGGQLIAEPSERTRRLLGALVAVYVGNPEAAIRPADLFAAGWPGEQIAWSAALNRLRVALSALRRLGLGSRLEHTIHGYRLREGSTVGLRGIDLTPEAAPLSGAPVQAE